MMRITTLLFALLLAGKMQAQEITGSWFSADSTRIYAITKTGDNLFKAVIKTSSRREDSIGFSVIKNLQYNAAKKRFEGLMYAVGETKPCFVKITAEGTRLNLRLSRMFVFDAVLHWGKAETNTL